MTTGRTLFTLVYQDFAARRGYEYSVFRQKQEKSERSEVIRCAHTTSYVHTNLIRHLDTAANRWYTRVHPSDCLQQRVIYPRSLLLAVVYYKPPAMLLGIHQYILAF